MPSNRGYWKEVSVATVVIKAEISAQQQSKIAKIAQIIKKEGLCLELVGIKGMWGLFGDGSLPVTPFDNSVRLGLGWPFPRGYYSMGMSVGREFPE